MITAIVAKEHNSVCVGTLESIALDFTEIYLIYKLIHYHHDTCMVQHALKDDKLFVIFG